MFTYFLRAAIARFANLTETNTFGKLNAFENTPPGSIPK